MVATPDLQRHPVGRFSENTGTGRFHSTREIFQQHHEAALHRNASFSPLRLGCIASSGLRTRCANCGLTPIGAEISIDGSCTLIGSGGPTLWRLRPMRPKTFFLVQAVAREYLLVGEMGSLMGELLVEVEW